MSQKLGSVAKVWLKLLIDFKKFSNMEILKNDSKLF